MALLRSHLEHYVQVWAPWYKKRHCPNYLSQVESHQGGHEAGEYDIDGETEGIRFVRPREAEAQRDFTALHCYLAGRHREIRARLCLEVDRVRMTVNKHILQQGTLKLNIRKNYYHESG